MHLTKSAQFQRGKAVEHMLDTFFRDHGYTVEELTQREERVLHLGDRRMTRSGKATLIEYKSGIQTMATGNVFLETISVDRDRTPGWVYTCRADFIVYAVPHDDDLAIWRLLFFKPERLRERIEVLKASYGVRKTGKGQNATYNTHGVAVPVAVAEKDLASKIVEFIGSLPENSQMRFT